MTYKIFCNLIRNALGPMDVICKVTELVEPICYNLKILDLMCGLVDFVSDSIVDIVVKGLSNANNIKLRIFFHLTKENLFLQNSMNSLRKSMKCFMCRSFLPNIHSISKRIHRNP